MEREREREGANSAKREEVVEKREERERLGIKRHIIEREGGRGRGRGRRERSRVGVSEKQILREMGRLKYFLILPGLKRQRFVTDIRVKSQPHSHTHTHTLSLH